MPSVGRARRQVGGADGERRPDRQAERCLDQAAPMHGCRPRGRLRRAVDERRRLTARAPKRDLTHGRRAQRQSPWAQLLLRTSPLRGDGPRRRSLMAGQRDRLTGDGDRGRLALAGQYGSATSRSRSSAASENSCPRNGTPASGTRRSGRRQRNARPATSAAARRAPTSCSRRSSSSNPMSRSTRRASVEPEQPCRLLRRRPRVIVRRGRLESGDILELVYNDTDGSIPG